MSVPADVVDTQRTGIITEALCFESYKQVIPVYYDTILSTKFTRDEESIEMLNLIREGLEYNFGFFFLHNITATAFQNLLSKQGQNPASYIASNMSSAEAFYKQIYDAYMLYIDNR